MSTVDQPGDNSELFDTDPTPVLHPKITKAALGLAARPNEHAIVVEFSHVAVGTEMYDPTGNEVALRNEVGRFAISSGGTSPAPGQIQIGTTIRRTDDSGRVVDGHPIGELGFFAGDVLIAVWSRSTGGPLFVKAEGFDVPFAYTLDVSVLPAGAVTVIVKPDPDGMAAMILRHEARANPHSQYALLSGADFTGPVSVERSLRVADAPGAGSSGMYAGSGDGASATSANLVMRSPYGIGFAPDVAGMPVPKTEHSHWFDARTGNTGMRGALTLRRTRQAVISADSNFDGLTIEASDLQNKEKKPVALAPWGGHVLVGKTDDDSVGLLQVAGPITTHTPPMGDASTRVPTTEWVVANIAAQAIGTIVLEVRASVRAGCLKLNGALLNRADYPELWAYAQASGAIVADADWGAKGFFGCFSHGDGATTFRIPEFRGEFPRFWDDGRGADGGRNVGTYQGFTNAAHAHGASTDVQGEHGHSAWTDVQGVHNHYVNDPGHEHGTNVPSGGGAGNQQAVVGPFGVSGHYTTTRSGTGIWLNNDGNHGHNVGIGAGGAHAHNVSIAVDGANEARPRNLAVLAMIRAY
ncbi:phage tail protein [Burkholderia arboris]|uniref:phage tail protein n=1 Tax=Burkholderia arboris TaxID=488730 RepID=UPI001CF4286D|nr:phage tail protein [Burkholderia arboris]MCA8037052.1 phage tail protein [Burkholderia arboris]